MNHPVSLPGRLSLAGDAEAIAEARVLGDLVNTLLAERFFAEGSIDWLTVGEVTELQAMAGNVIEALAKDILWLRWWMAREEGRAIVFPVRAAIVQPYRYVPLAGVLAIRFDEMNKLKTCHRLTPETLMKQVVEYGLEKHEREQPGVGNVLRLLSTTLWQTRQSLEGAVSSRGLLAMSTAEAFQALERRAALRDRPFHPVAKAKEGLDEASHERYAAEFDCPMTLRWVAIDRRHVMQGASADALKGEPLDLIPTQERRRALEAEMACRGLSRDTHLAIPVHPWQMQHGLPRHLAEALANGGVTMLETEGGSFQATSSLRSLAPVDASRFYLKLPMAVFSLGAARYLPAVKLINGERGQRMLEQAQSCDDVLRTSLHLCDERRWWSYMPDGSGLFDDAPRHLGAMAREYPTALLEDDSVRLIPMAAIGTPLSRSDGHFFDEWMQYRALANDANTVVGLFGEVCTSFFDIVLRLYRLGLMPEIHGQNAVLVWRKGYVDGLLLRDHDSVRLHPQWARQHGIDDPDYQIRPGYSNSLYNDTPRDLLFYLQTLGIQVNLYAIIDTLVQHYAVEEAILWHELGRCLEEGVASLGIAGEERSRLKEVLFGDAQWPLKCVLRPLLDQQGVPGSMPSAKSVVPNPFHSTGLTLHSTGLTLHSAELNGREIHGV